MKKRSPVSKKQIKKDFKELYTGQNTEELVKKYYCKKKRQMVFLVIFGVFVFVSLLIYEEKKSKIPAMVPILRNENGEGKKEVFLEVKTKENGWKELALELTEKEFSEEELEEMYLSAKKLLPDFITSENDTINHITEDINLIQEIEGYPFLLVWEIDDNEFINFTGEIIKEEIPDEGVEVKLRAIFKYLEWEKNHEILLKLYPKKENDFMDSLILSLKKAEAESRKEKQFYLPDRFEDNELQWRFEKENSAIFLGILFLVLLPVIDYQKDREIHKLVKVRLDELKRQYPEFISKLILYMEAGMNINGAFYKMADDYQKKKKNGKQSSYLYEELLYVCRQNRNGLSQEESYLLLGKRCNLPCYKKLAGLLVQHLKKGNCGILEALRAEAGRANEERKKHVKKQGEEMGTKLLLPMMMMLMIVMVLIMVPACFSFQI